MAISEQFKLLNFEPENKMMMLLCTEEGSKWKKMKKTHSFLQLKMKKNEKKKRICFAIR
jgi:hypothetical protein